jgi:hypothetical protein
MNIYLSACMPIVCVASSSITFTSGERERTSTLSVVRVWRGEGEFLHGLQISGQAGLKLTSWQSEIMQREGGLTLCVCNAHRRGEEVPSTLQPFFWWCLMGLAFYIFRNQLIILRD